MVLSQVLGGIAFNRQGPGCSTFCSRSPTFALIISLFNYSSTTTITITTNTYTWQAPGKGSLDDSGHDKNKRDKDLFMGFGDRLGLGLKSAVPQAPSLFFTLASLKKKKKYADDKE